MCAPALQLQLAAGLLRCMPMLVDASMAEGTACRSAGVCGAVPALHSL